MMEKKNLADQDWQRQPEALNCLASLASAFEQIAEWTRLALQNRQMAAILILADETVRWEELRQ